MIHSLARFFRALHFALGVTAPPADAPYEAEKKFVIMWFGMLAMIAGTIVLLAYLFVEVF